MSTARGFFFFNDTATTEIYTSIDTLSLHDALPIHAFLGDADPVFPSRTVQASLDRLRAEIGRAHSELQSPIDISYAVFCLKKKKNKHRPHRMEYEQTRRMNYMDERTCM